MPKKKKKISELALADSLTGLYTIGCKIIDGIQTSVKVSLGTIQTAYENMLTEISNARAATKAATSKANTATANAITATNEAKAATTNATAAATKANTAATNADNARVGLETLKANTEKATQAANTAASLANDKAVYANTQGNFAKTQGDRAQELADHPWKVGDNGNWWKWDLDGDRYVDTGILAKGGVLYPTFTINPADMTLVMSYEDEVSPNLVKLNQETGELYLNV
ncbi:hypothetical protein [Parabacteroides distasonis]|jgi:hypothetical protein|uniref:hypothetical protein n=2 Tax=Parabacteroides distasonis TaxID=823 RepID=UPI0022E54D45|nr:hypothetical protein [Parabacteroides distasonis]